MPAAMATSAIFLCRLGTQPKGIGDGMGLEALANLLSCAA